MPRPREDGRGLTRRVRDLLARRAAHRQAVLAIDRELAAAFALLAEDRPAEVPPTPTAAAAESVRRVTSDEAKVPTAARARDAAIERCARAILERLKVEALSGQALERELGGAHGGTTVSNAVRRLLAEARVVAIGTTGRGRRIALPSAQAPAPPRAATKPPRPAKRDDDGLEVTWPPRDDPRAPLRVLTEGRAGV